MAEAVRFELTNGCPLPVFKTGAIDHSATLPYRVCDAAHILAVAVQISQREYWLHLARRILQSASTLV